MTRRSKQRGFFAIGIENSKTGLNLGTLWRTANLFDAAFIFTVGPRRYRHQCSDTLKTPRHIPLFRFDTVDDLFSHLPWSCELVGVELDDRATPLHEFTHLQNACYLLGAEDHGLCKATLDRCHRLVRLPGRMSMNVAVAGSIVINDRWEKLEAPRCAVAAE